MVPNVVAKASGVAGAQRTRRDADSGVRADTAAGKHERTGLRCSAGPRGAEPAAPAIARGGCGEPGDGATTLHGRVVAGVVAGGVVALKVEVVVP